MASFSNTFLMYPREIPTYLKTAYSIRYKNELNEGNCIQRICHAVQRFFVLVREILYYPRNPAVFEQTRQTLERDFEVIHQNLAEDKPLCVYFVRPFDYNGAILGNAVYYYHHYKIQGLQKDFAVAPKLVSTQQEMIDFMRQLKEARPNQDIRFVDVVSHGGKSSLGQEGLGRISPEEIRDDLFSECAPDATILLDACTTGLGDRNIADEMARKNPGKTILAPGPSLFFSKPVIQRNGGVPSVVSAVHGFAIFNAYTCKTFRYDEAMPSRYPYVRDETLQQDIQLFLGLPVLRNLALDRYCDENDRDVQFGMREIFRQLSDEAKALVCKQIFRNAVNPDKEIDAIDEADRQQGTAFFEANPLHPQVRAAFRSVLNELVHEVREYSGVQLLKKYVSIYNFFEAIGAWWSHHLCRRPANQQAQVV